MNESDLQTNPDTLWQVIGAQWEPITAVTAVVIALCALGLTIYQARIAREQVRSTQEHNKLSVRPHLEASEKQTGHPPKVFELAIENNGLGPAIIKRFNLTVPVNFEVPDEKDPFEWTLRFHFDKPNYPQPRIEVTPLRPGDSISGNNGTRTIAQISYAIVADPKKVWEAFDIVRVEVEYESMYGDKFPPLVYTRGNLIDWSATQ